MNYVPLLNSIADAADADLQSLETLWSSEP